MQLRSACVIAALLAGGCTSPEAELHDAAMRGDAAKVEKLVSKTPALVHHRNAKNKGRTALHEANNRAVALSLLSHGADLHAGDAESHEPLFVARSGELVDVLLERGLTVSTVIHGGMTPLHTAESTSAAASLVGHGLAVDTRDKKGQTPLFQQVQSEDEVHLAMVSWLLDAGAEAGAMDAESKTPMHFAKPRAVPLLVKHLAHPDAQDKFGATPLHYAVLDDQLPKAEALLTNGASAAVVLNHDIVVKETSGPGGMNVSTLPAGHYTPLKLARTEPMRALLRKHGATE